MAEHAVVSVSTGAIKPVLAKLHILMGDEYKKIRGLRKAITSLQDDLACMDAFLEKMDDNDELDPKHRQWRKDTIEMSYDIEDLIDGFMHHVDEPGNMGIVLSRYLRTVNNLHRLANEIQNIKADLPQIIERPDRQSLDRHASFTNRVFIGPRLEETRSPVGIDAQKSKLVNWAMDEEKQLELMAIVGLGGSGKTTLANEVYREVGGKFDCKAFVSVSQQPDIAWLFNDLLSQLGLCKYSHDHQVFDSINKLRTHLHDKRYFFVVDDLWDIMMWRIISIAFPQNNQRSRIVITTRMKSVGSACCGEFVHTMELLSKEDSSKLFFNRIFGSEDACPAELMKPSHEILKKCGGLPLVIITMASLLAFQPTRSKRQWEYIQNSVTTEFASNPNYGGIMMHILDLSYKNLPRDLKTCFLYLGSYPEDYEISRFDLLRRWVAEGFVSDRYGEDVWDIAESYFNELVNRSMIQPTYRKNITGVFGCRVHNILLDFILRKCNEDNFFELGN